jgi:hypothetical protein
MAEHDDDDGLTGGPVIEDAPFKALRALNCPDGHRLARQRHRLLPELLPWFRGDPWIERLAARIAEQRIVDVKELCESVELHARVHRRLRAPVMADLCCGHGLTGLLFALLEREVTEVYLIDRRRPASHDQLLQALDTMAPWVRPKVRYVEAPLKTAASVLPRGASLLGLHACGGRTDDCLRLAIALRGPVAVMPCCYGQTTPDAPRALRSALGRRLSSDIHRTYRLVEAGYEVEWSAIPRAVTPMNRILIGLPRAAR